MTKVEFEVKFIDPEENASWFHNYNSLTQAVMVAINTHNNKGCATVRKKVTVELDDGKKHTKYYEILKLGHKSIQSVGMTFDELYDLLKNLYYNMNTIVSNWDITDAEIVNNGE